MTTGGYLSFWGFQAKVNYRDTPIEVVLLVDVLPYDDRVETPEGVSGVLTETNRAVTQHTDREWPVLLGYQKLIAKSDATVFAESQGHPLLAVRNVDAGRTLASDISPHQAPEEFRAWPSYKSLFDQDGHVALRSGVVA
jgi:uncharacterized membrane protein